MTPQQIKANAPEGATHYIQKRTRVQYWRSYKKQWWVYIGGQWVEAVKSIYRDYSLQQAKPL